MNIPGFIHATAHTLTTIFNEICRTGSEFDQVIDTIISPNFHQKQELISELAVSFCSNEDSILKAIQNNYFKYFFIRTVKNQIHSKTSPFHKNVRKTTANEYEGDYIELDKEIDDEQDLEKKQLTEYKFELVEDALLKTNVTYFESEMFRMYYYENKTYRQIEEECDIDHCLVFQTVKKVLNKVKKQINNLDIY